MADRGGTLLVVRDVDGHVFGGFASTPWHVSPHYFGTGECFLFSASPAFRCWPWTGAPLPPSPLASRPSPLAPRPFRGPGQHELCLLRLYLPWPRLPAGFLVNTSSFMVIQRTNVVMLKLLAIARNAVVVFSGIVLFQVGRR